MGQDQSSLRILKIVSKKLSPTIRANEPVLGRHIKNTRVVRKQDKYTRKAIKPGIQKIAADSYDPTRKRANQNRFLSKNLNK